MLSFIYLVLVFVAALLSATMSASSKHLNLSSVTMDIEFYEVPNAARNSKRTSFLSTDLGKAVFSYKNGDDDYFSGQKTTTNTTTITTVDPFKDEVIWDSSENCANGKSFRYITVKNWEGGSVMNFYKKDRKEPWISVYSPIDINHEDGIFVPLLRSYDNINIPNDSINNLRVSFHRAMDNSDVLVDRIVITKPFPFFRIGPSPYNEEL